MIQLGLTGYPLSHSLSPRLHAAAFAALGLAGDYRLYPVPLEDGDGLADLAGRLRAGKLDGLNITIPYKQTILAYVDDLTVPARAIGAVNTLYCEDGCLIGHNTDAPGFMADLDKVMPELPREPSALVLGAGGAARAVVYALLARGWRVTLAVRRADLEQAAVLCRAFAKLPGGEALVTVFLEREALSDRMEGLGLIVHATPLGMSPDSASTPWPEGLSMPPGALVYDLVYQPRQTRLLCQAERDGLRTASGLGMLVEQAALSFETWLGIPAPRREMRAAVEAA